MRFIHTADWHLGSQMHGIDRKKEAESFLNWLKNIIEEKKAETLIVSGDIFDTATPSVEARRLYEDFLASLYGTCCKNVVITGGNHDSAALLEASSRLMEHLDIHVIGAVSNHKASDLCFELKDEGGLVTGICMAVPFVREGELRNLFDDEGQFAYRKLYDWVFNAAEELRKDRKLPLVCMGHLYASDLEGRLSNGNPALQSDDGVRPLDVVGNLGSISPSVFPEKADYVALGHIHYSTMVEKNPKIRYSGSPFVMGFDEADMPHYVLCVDINEGEEEKLSTEKIEVPRYFKYKRLSGELEEIKAELEKLSLNAEKKAKSEKNSEEEQNPLFLELCYKKKIEVSAPDFLEDAIRSLPENITVVSWKVLSSEGGNYFYSGDLEAEEIKGMSDDEIFTRLILSKMNLVEDSEEGKAAIKEFLPLFRELSEEINKGGEE